jgi:hypothetical protein
MPDWLEATLAMLCGLAPLGGVFWLTFARAPSRRSDEGLSNKGQYGVGLTHGDYGGPSS